MSEPIPPESPRPLDYATPTRPAGGVPFMAQMAIGFGAFVATISSTSVLLALVNPVGGTTLANVLLITVWAMPVVILTVLSSIAWRLWRWRGFLVGVLIGLGLVLLLIGLCFAMFSL